MAGLPSVPPRTPDETPEGVAQQVSFAINRLFGIQSGQDKSPGALEFLPASVLAPQVIKVLRSALNNPAANLRNRDIPLRIIESLQNPDVARRANAAWSQVGYSAKPTQPRVLGGGIDAVGLEVKPYSRGGELLKLFDKPITSPSSTIDMSPEQVARMGPKDFVMPHRQWGNIENRRGDPQFGWMTSPIAEFPYEGKPTAKEFHAQRRMLEELARKQGWVLEDAHTGNIGVFRRRPFVTDEGSAQLNPFDPKNVGTDKLLEMVRDINQAGAKPQDIFKGAMKMGPNEKDEYFFNSVADKVGTREAMRIWRQDKEIPGYKQNALDKLFGEP